MNLAGKRELRLAGLMAAFIGLGETAWAESLICKNPLRAYNLIYDQAGSDVLINPESDKVVWSVISSLLNDSQHVLMVELGPEGMTAQIHLRPFQKVEIFSQGQLIQTDACHSAVGPISDAQSSTVPKSARFSSFDSEIAVIQNLTKCPKATLSRDSGLPDLWGCIFPGAEVVKVFVNEDGKGGVKNVKLMWNDWTRNNGYGVHRDSQVALAWLSVLAARYAPHSVAEVMKAFEKNRDVTVQGDGYRLAYTYSKGPAIDERLVTITAD